MNSRYTQSNNREIFIIAAEKQHPFLLLCLHLQIWIIVSSAQSNTIIQFFEYTRQLMESS